MIEKESHIENVYAFDENFKEIYIGDVAYIDRGIKKKYFCLGCKKQMQAIKPQTKRMEHFRHHVKPNSTESKCTYRDESHRHFLAKANALDLKRIKVPAVYKYPPNKVDDQVLLIKEAEFIEAHTVLNEHYVYENEQGEIQVSATFNGNEDNYLFIKPDSLFLDKEGKPILIIEFVATHKPDQDKLMKLKRLGIDAIQVNVPKSSPEEIRDLFFNTKRTKWLYNYAENETDYLQFSNSDSGGIFEIDDEQRRLFEEGYKCRKAQLGDFIRTIGRILESEHYREVEQNLKSEIRRVEENTKREAAELDELRTNYSESGIKQHSQRREELGNRQNEFLQKIANLEGRYYRKREELVEEQNGIDRDISTIEYRLDGNKQSGKTIERAIYEETESVRRLGERIEYDRKEKEREIENIDKSIEREKGNIEHLPKQFEREKETIELEFRTEEESIEREIESIDNRIINATGHFERERERLEAEFASDSKRILKEIENGNSDGSGWYSREISSMDSFKKQLILYKSTLEILERVEQKERDYSTKN